MAAGEVQRVASALRREHRELHDLISARISRGDDSSDVPELSGALAKLSEALWGLYRVDGSIMDPRLTVLGARLDVAAMHRDLMTRRWRRMSSLAVKSVAPRRIAGRVLQGDAKAGAAELLAWAEGSGRVIVPCWDLLEAVQSGSTVNVRCATWQAVLQYSLGRRDVDGGPAAIVAAVRRRGERGRLPAEVFERYVAPDLWGYYAEVGPILDARRKRVPPTGRKYTCVEPRPATERERLWVSIV